MKTFYQFREDIAQRRIAAKQQRSDQISSHRQSVADYHAAQRSSVERKREREELKGEIKKELQTEQTPTMDQKPYNVMIAKQQAYRKRAREAHAQREMEHEAGAQLSAKRARLKAIMSR